MLYAPGRLLSPIAGGATPSLDLNFMTGAMPAGITFTRASTAWAYNSSGVLTAATTNTPRFDYDPATLTARGLLIEEARTNLVPGTMTGGTYWTALGTVIAAGSAAPDGTTNAATLTENASGVTSYGANIVSTVTITGSAATTASIFVKPGTCTFFRLILADAVTPTIGAQAYYNLSTGAAGTTGTQSGAPTGVSATISAAGGGWYRCTLTGTLGAATTGVILLRMVSADATTTDTGSKALSLWQPQIEVGAFATSPILTTTAAVARAADVATINPLGSWFSAAAGTAMVEASLIGTAASRNILSVSDNTANELYQISTTAGGVLQFVVTDGGVSQAAIGSGVTATAGTTFKAAATYALNDFAACANGGTVGTDASGSLPTVDRAYLAASATGANPATIYLRRLRIYDRRLASATLQVITS